MRETKQTIAFIMVWACALAGGGCTTAGWLDSGTSLDQLLGGAALSINEPASGVADSDSLTGTVSSGDYALFEFPDVSAAERWRIESAGRSSSNVQFTVALFDRDMNLLARSPSIKALALDHVFRRSNAGVYLGVAPSYGSAGGEFSLRVYRDGAANIPGPNPQVVYLNFQGASDVKVHIRAPMNIGPFRALDLNPDYFGNDELIKQVITQTVRDDYAPFEVLVYSSDEGPPPAGGYSTLYFGGEEPTLLGLADNVDQYNQNLSQTAVIFVSTFAPFSTMELTAQEMGGMIGNVASHELGHLLGLYHTANPQDIMDTTGSAWDLAEDQAFATAKLEPTVFPVGNQNSPTTLSDSVGRKSSDALLDRPPVKAKNEMRAALRRLIHEELRWSCGNCADQ